MARVYLAFSRGPADVHKLVVMKQMHSELARDKHFVTMFLDEARIATRLNHPNVVHTYGVLEEEGRYTLMMEYLDGQTLLTLTKPAVENIQIDITASPSSARLSLDGKLIGANRLKAEVPRDEAIHVIRATAPGYLPFHHVVTFSSDVRLTVSLKGERPRSVKTRSRWDQAKGAQSEQPAPAEATPPAKQGSGAIDENNPYARYPIEEP